MNSSESEQREDFVEPIEGDRPDCPWPSKMAWRQNDAEQVAKLMRGKGHPDVRAYECWGCGLWHVGKNQEAFARRVRAVLSQANNRHYAERRRRNKRGKR